MSTGMFTHLCLLRGRVAGGGGGGGLEKFCQFRSVGEKKSKIMLGTTTGAV